MSVLLVVQSEIADKSLSVAPAFLDLYPAAQIDFAHEKVLHILTGFGGNLFEHFTLFADYDSLVTFPLTVDGGVNIGYASVGTLLHPFNADGNSVRNFIIEHIQKLLTNNLGGYHALGLVGQSVVREKVR